MLGFDVLNRKQALRSSLFIEASAGTGKTFAMETLFVRMIAEEGFGVDQILVVTFTKAATHELRSRIRKALEKTLNEMDHDQSNIDWIKALDESKKIKAKRYLRLALFSFDEAQIFTIHGFCHHLLQEHSFKAHLNLDIEFERSVKKELNLFIKDFFRTELKDSLISPFQFEKVMSVCHRDFDTLIAKIIKLISFRLPIVGGFTFQEFHDTLVANIASLKNKNVDAEKMKASLLDAAAMFRGFNNSKKELKQEALDAILCFCELFEETGISFENSISFLKKSEPLLFYAPQYMLKKMQNKVFPEDLLFITFQKIFIPLLEQALDPSFLIASLSREAKKVVDRFMQHEELFFFEDFLLKCAQIASDREFVQQIHACYKSVLIDEFQDVDSLQWSIFSSIFMEGGFQGCLYLVGDPKQAIYAFRGADIYTYLSAKENFSKNAQTALTVNYRSQSQLIKGLNKLHSSLPDLFALPRQKKFIECPKVVSPEGNLLCDWKDLKKDIHIFESTQEDPEHALFMFVIDEILSLWEQGESSLSNIAVLVSDRYQARRFQYIADSVGLPLSFKRAESLIDSKALLIWLDWIEVLLTPKNLSSLFKILGSPLVGLTEDEILHLLNSQKSLQEIVKLFYNFRACLEKEGIILFFHAWMKSFWNDISFLTRILSQKQGLSLYSDLLQLAEMAALSVHSLEGWIPFFESLKKEDPEKEEYKKRFTDVEASVQVMTIHASKGLEFDYVFPLGLITPAKKLPDYVLEDRHLHVVGDENQKSALKQELAAESMRLFYVATTRAKKRLYLPNAPEVTETPMNLFLSKFFKGSYSFEKWVQDQDEFSFSLCPNKISRKHQKTNPIQTESASPCITPLPAFKEVFIHSYSSLAKGEATLERSVSSSDFPVGKEIGNLFHTILEKMDFSLFSSFNYTDLFSFVESFVAKTPYHSSTKQIVECIYHTLHAKFVTPHATFSLKDVDSRQMEKEMDFLFFSKDPLFPGYIKGVIDLFFEYQEKIYLIDWKSNYLGSEKKDYSKEAIHQAMQAHDYYLQEKIYREALKRHCALFDKRPFDMCFGGSFYIFLRGLPEEGVFCIE